MSCSIVAGRAVLEIPFGTQEDAKLMYDALLPETESVPTDRAKTVISVVGSVLRVEIRANDLTALRASMNSFLAWISACKRTLDTTCQNP